MLYYMVTLDVLQSKNAVAGVIFIHCYHSVMIIRLHQFPSPVLFFSPELSQLCYPTPFILSTPLSSGIPSPLSFYHDCGLKTLRNFFLTSCIFTFLFILSPSFLNLCCVYSAIQFHPLLSTINHSFLHSLSYFLLFLLLHLPLPSPPSL